MRFGRAALGSTKKGDRGMPLPRRLAAISYTRGFDIDALLVGVCQRLSKDGVRIGGLLQISTGGEGGCASTVHVVDLRTNAVFDIWEERGACARGCRLDERGLAAAAVAVERAIVDRVDLLVFNRFGRAESLGRGLFDCFVSALSADVPVLTAVRASYDEAWSRFHGGLGLNLPNEPAAAVSWACRLAVRSEPPRVAI
jgi:Protein of unknown function (DUF2478)